MHPFLRVVILNEGQCLLPVWLLLSFVKGVAFVVVMKGDVLAFCIQKSTGILEFIDYVCEMNTNT